MVSHLAILLLSSVIVCCFTQHTTEVEFDNAGDTVVVKYNCPNLKIPVCENQCLNNDDCDKGKWCCTGSCGAAGETAKTCVEPTKRACPPQREVFSKCKDSCSTDEDCTKGYVCCEGGCNEVGGTSYRACVAINICFDYCQNGGNCSYVEFEKVACTCPPGYKGDKCEIEINECDAEPCVHGTCKDKFNDYQCCCDEGYSGKNCTESVDLCAGKSYVENMCPKTCRTHPKIQTLCKMVPRLFLQTNGADVTDECLNARADSHKSFYMDNKDASQDACSGYCDNGGTCIKEFDQQKCYCAPGFIGMQCKTKIRKCDAEPCVHGECIDKVNDYQCCCEEGYSGKNCTEKDLCGQKSSSLVNIKKIKKNMIPDLCYLEKKDKCEKFPGENIICRMEPRLFVQKNKKVIDVTDACRGYPNNIKN